MNRELSQNTVKKGVLEEEFRQDPTENRRLATAGGHSEGVETVTFDRLELHGKLLELKGAIEAGEMARANDLSEGVLLLTSTGLAGTAGS